MWRDPIVDEIHRIREEHARKFNYDLRSIYLDLKRKEKKSGHKTVALPVKRRQLEKATS